MRKVIFSCILIIIVFSCTITEKSPSVSFDSHLLWGEWHLDSVSNGTSDYQTLFVSKNHRFHMFSYSLGDELILHGYYKNQKLFNQYDLEYPITYLDSNTLILNDESNKTTLFYKKSVGSNPKERLKQAMSGNKLRSKVLGWWRYKKNKDDGVMYYPKYFFYNSFIMHIREDGKAEVFENFKTQSSLLFNYGFYNNCIQLRDRCIVTSLDIITIEKNKLTITGIRDTLVLERITKFK